MPDILAIVSKAQFEEQHKGAKPGDVLPIDRYLSANKALSPVAGGGAIFLATVRPPDEKLWLVGVLEAPDFDGAKWTAEANQAPVTDLKDVRTRLQFSTGKGIQAKPGALGMSLQTPRLLTPGDAALLRASFGGGKRAASRALASAAKAAPASAAKAAPAAKSAKAAPAEAPPPKELEKEPEAAAPVAGAVAVDELARAASALAVGDRGTALTALATAWRACRAPELEALIDVVSRDAARGLPAIAGERAAFDEAWSARERLRRPVDLFHLVAGLTHEPVGGIPLRLRALLDWERDPRLGPVMVAMIAEPPLTASSNFSTWTTLFKALPDFVDTRATKTLEKRAREKGGASQFWPKLTAWIEAVLPKLPVPASLSPGAGKRVAAMVIKAEALARGPAPLVGVSDPVAATPGDRRSLAERLSAAASALGKRDHATALADLLAFWADKRAPEVAELIEKLGHLVAAKQPSIVDGKPHEVHARWMELGRRPQPADVTRLLAALTVGKLADADERLAQMLHWPPDPRVTPRLLALVSDYMIGARPTFWRAVYDLFVVHADPRTAAEITSDHDRRDDANAILDRAAALRSNSRRTFAAYQKMLEGDPTLSKSERATVADLALAVEHEVKTAASSSKSALANDEALVNEIAAHFDDDAPRLVYADLLSERGDVRGPYITMAIAHARGEGKLKGKLEAYEKKHRNELFGPLKPLIVSYNFKLARGFLDEVQLQDRGVPWADKPAINALLGDLRWATLRSIDFDSDGSGTQSTVVLERAPLGSLRRLKSVTLADLGKLLMRDETFRVETIEDLKIDSDDEEKELPVAPALAQLLARAHEKLPALHTLDLYGFDPPPEALLRAPLVQRLERVTGGNESYGGQPRLATWMQRLQAVRWPVPTLTVRSSWVSFTVASGKGGLQSLTLDLSSTWFDSGWKDEFPQYLAALQAIPAGIFPSVMVKLGDRPEEVRAAARAALLHLRPTAI